MRPYLKITPDTFLRKLFLTPFYSDLLPPYAGLKWNVVIILWRTLFLFAFSRLKDR